METSDFGLLGAFRLDSLKVRGRLSAPAYFCRLSLPPLILDQCVKVDKVGLRLGTG